MARVRLKNYVDVMELEKMIIVSNSFGRGSIYVSNDLETRLMLKSLKSEEGVESAICKSNQLYLRLLNSSLIEETPYQDKKRNQLFFEYIKAGFHIPLDKRILVLGAGAAGGTISYLLAQQGFKQIFTLDDDKVEESDIEKTLVYDLEAVGDYKVHYLQKRTEANFKNPIFPILKRIESIKDIRLLISDISPDMIIYAIDPDAYLKLYLNKICVDKNIPIIHASYSFDKILCGPFVIPQKTACYIGYNEYWKARTNGMFDYGKTRKLFRETTIHPSISFNINVLASIIVKDVIFALANDYEHLLTKNKILEICLISGGIVSYELSCGFCSSCKHMCKSP